MDRIIILIIVYLIACYIWKKIDCSRHRKIHNAVLFISSIMVIIGCITPLNSTYIILCAIILILLDCLVKKYGLHKVIFFNETFIDKSRGRFW